MDDQAVWFDNAWWEDRIHFAASTHDPVLCNRRITLAHYDLSLALRKVLGPETGANFHTWATWGSKKAGVTIGQRDIRGLKWAATLAGAGAGTLVMAGLRPLGLWSAAARVTAVALSGWAARALTARQLDHAARMILAGNITVLEDIGRVTARFVSVFHDEQRPDPQRLETFLTMLRPGRATREGQDLLKRAFAHYYLARHESDANCKHEHMLMANLYAILHEHMRLEPYIDGAMAGAFRRLVTRSLLAFDLGDQRLDVSEDVPEWRGRDIPTTLVRLDNSELTEFLGGPEGWDRTPDSLLGSRARNWSELRDRMNYICDLFRTRHFDPGLFLPPYSEVQRADIMAGGARH